MVSFIFQVKYSHLFLRMSRIPYRCLRQTGRRNTINKACRRTGKVFKQVLHEGFVVEILQARHYHTNTGWICFPSGKLNGGHYQPEPGYQGVLFFQGVLPERDKIYVLALEAFYVPGAVSSIVGNMARTTGL